MSCFPCARKYGKINQFIFFLERIIKKRKVILEESDCDSFRTLRNSGKKLPDILLIIDNYLALSETYESIDETQGLFQLRLPYGKLSSQVQDQMNTFERQTLSEIDAWWAGEDKVQFVNELTETKKELSKVFNEFESFYKDLNTKKYPQQNRNIHPVWQEP